METYSINNCGHIIETVIIILLIQQILIKCLLITHTAVNARYWRDRENIITALNLGWGGGEQGTQRQNYK